MIKVTQITMKFNELTTTVTYYLQAGKKEFQGTINYNTKDLKELNGLCQAFIDDLKHTTKQVIFEGHSEQSKGSSD